MAIGSFRAYPDSYKDGKATEAESVPLAKFEEFGLHANKYYKLETTFFKSKTDQDLLERLWTRYWVHTISSQTLVKSREFMAGCLVDVGGKLERCRQKGRGHGLAAGGKDDYSKVVKETIKAALEASGAMSMELMRDLLFNQSIY